jgi:hypothetical protein
LSPVSHPGKVGAVSILIKLTEPSKDFSLDTSALEEEEEEEEEGTLSIKSVNGIV